MKYFIGFMAAIIVTVFLMLMNQYALKFEIPDYLIGWLSCTAYYSLSEFYDNGNFNN